MYLDFFPSRLIKFDNDISIYTDYLDGKLLSTAVKNGLSPSL